MVKLLLLFFISIAYVAQAQYIYMHRQANLLDSLRKNYFWDYAMLQKHEPKCFLFWYSSVNGVEESYIKNSLSLSLLPNKRFEAVASLSGSEQMYKAIQGSYSQLFMSYKFTFDTAQTCYLSADLLTDSLLTDSSYYFLPIETDSFWIYENGEKTLHYPRDTAIYKRVIITDSVALARSTYIILCPGVFWKRRRCEKDSYDSIDLGFKVILFKTKTKNCQLQIAIKEQVSTPLQIDKAGLFLIKFYYNPVKISTVKRTRMMLDCRYHFMEIISQDAFILDLDNWDFILPNSHIYLHSDYCNASRGSTSDCSTIRK